MKEHIKMMKANATTEEDRQAIKEFKEQIKEMKKSFKSECKADWKAEKQQWKEYKKCGKDKRDKKDKKCDKTDRFVAKHVADVTVPDNSELPADTPVTKTWRLRNAGVNTWPADSQLIFVSKRGDNLNGPERVLVGAVEPQREVDVSVTFITPSEPGRYIGYYRMATSDGIKFGQRVWVSFIINTAAANQARQQTPTAPLLYPVVSSGTPTTTTTAASAYDVTMH